MDHNNINNYNDVWSSVKKAILHGNKLHEGLYILTTVLCRRRPQISD